MNISMNADRCRNCPNNAGRICEPLDIAVSDSAKILCLITAPMEADIAEGAVYAALTYQSAAFEKLVKDTNIPRSSLVVSSLSRCVQSNPIGYTPAGHMHCASRHLDETRNLLPDIKAIVAFGDLPLQVLLTNFRKSADECRNTEVHTKDGMRIFSTYPLSALTDTGCSSCNTNARRILMSKDLQQAWNFVSKESK